MRVKAYIPGTENVLTGDDWDARGARDEGPRNFLGRIKVSTPIGYQEIDLYEPWVIEPILELPTKRDALVRYTDGGGFSNTAWRHSADTAYPWSDASGGMDDDALMQEIKDHSDGKFTVIFEGLDD